MLNLILLILAVVFTILLGALFGGAETGIYQLSRVRLRLGVERKRLSFVILSKVMHDSAALLLSTFIGNNLAHYAATSIVTFLLLSRVQSEYAAELFATLLTVPVLFVFSELVPKNIFFYRADSLMPLIAPVLFAFHKLFSWCGMVSLLKKLSHIFARLTGSPTPSKTAIAAVRSPYIRVILQETREEDILSSVQTDIINRLADISGIDLRSVMTPVNKVQMVGAGSDRPSLLKILKKCVFTRLPVYESSPANIVGFINIYDCLSSPEEFLVLNDFIKPIRKLSGDTNVADAINIMRGENQKITLVTRTGPGGREKPVGIVTMKDLVEELLGELTEW